MNEPQLNYLKAIVQQLGGPIRAAVSDKMTAYLVECTHALAIRLLANAATGDRSTEHFKQAFVDLSGELYPILELSSEGKQLIEEIDAVLTNSASSDQIDNIAARTTAILMRDVGTESQRIAQILVNTDTANWRTIESEVQAIRADASPRIEREVEALSESQKHRLVDLLRKHCSESNDLSIKHVFAVPGGYSKQTIIVTLDHNRILPEQIVIRRDRAESPVGTTVKDEMDLLSALYKQGIKVPKPWLVDDSVMTTPLIIVSKVEGVNIGDVYTVFDKREEYALELADELSRLHALEFSTIGVNLPGMTVGNIEFMQQEISQLLGHWRQMDEYSVTVEAAFVWLHQRIDWADGPRALIHRDPRFHNVLCQNHHITVLLDWELAMIGNPARDLGWLYHQVTQIITWDKFLERYIKAGGQILSPQSLAFYALWSELFCTIQMYRARAGFHSGEGIIQYAYAGEEMRQHNMCVLAERLSQVMRKGAL